VQAAETVVSAWLDLHDRFDATPPLRPLQGAHDLVSNAIDGCANRPVRDKRLIVHATAIAGRKVPAINLQQHCGMLLGKIGEAGDAREP